MVATLKRTFLEYAQDGRQSSHDGTYFAPTASIVLIGIRGTGKSSLAFLAASAYSRRVVEYDREFQLRTGQALKEHRQDKADQQGRKKRKEILNQVLQAYSEDSIVICDFADLEYGAATLVNYGKSHPVIHVQRDFEGLKAHLTSWPETNIKRLLEDSAKLLRDCSTHEFFNLTEEGREPSAAMSVSSHVNDTHPEETQEESQPFLRLKRTERDFLKFLRLVLGDHSRSPYQSSAYPLSSLAIEARQHTYAAVIRPTHVLGHSIDLEAFQVGSDAFLLQAAPSTSTHLHAQASKVAKAFAIVRRATILPIILDPGSNDPHSLRFCARLAPDYIIQRHAASSKDHANITDNITTKSRTKIIGFHQLKTIEIVTPDWLSQVKASSFNPPHVITMLQAQGRDRDCMAQIDELRGNWHRAKADSPRFSALSAFNVGRQGRFSQVTNDGVLPVIGETPMSPNGGEEKHASQEDPSLTAREATMALFTSHWFSPLKFNIIGASVDFSLSPAMHNAAYEAVGMPHKFTARSSPSLAVLDELVQDEDFGGAAITQPYKISATEKLASLSEAARIIRAVNTIVPIRRNGGGSGSPTDEQILNSRNESGNIHALHGYNTDWIGMRACLRRGLSPVNAVRKSSSGLVVGAGGMARAAIYALIHMGVQNVFIYNRTVSRAEDLATYYNEWLSSRQDAAAAKSSNGAVDRPTVHVLRSLDEPWPDKWRPPTMIISSVPPQIRQGKLEGVFTLPINWLASPSGGVVVELTYNPLVTALVEQISSQAHRGWIIMTGLDMLPEQAFAQFELFTGRRAPRHIMQSEVLKAFRELKG